MLLGVLIIAAWMAGLLVNYLGDVLPARRMQRAAAEGMPARDYHSTHAVIQKPACRQCSAPYPWRAYLLWPSACPSCGAHRPARFGWVQILAVAAAVWFYSTPPTFMPLPMVGLVMVYFGVVIVIDLEHKLILHPVSLAGALLAGGIGIYLHGWWFTLLGALAGLAMMFVMYLFGVLLVKQMARWRDALEPGDALGFGDVVLGGVLGLLLGWPGILLGIVLAILLGGAGSLLVVIRMLVHRKYQADAVIPYGPFLVTSAILLLFFSQLF